MFIPDLGFLLIPDPGSRCQKVTGIPDPDPQHCLKTGQYTINTVFLIKFFTEKVFSYRIYVLNFET